MILTVTLNSCVHTYITYRDSQPEKKVIRPVRTRQTAGGKGFNAARVVTTLGGKSCALGFAGGAAGEELRRSLEAEGVWAELVTARSTTRRSFCLYEECTGSFRELLEAGEDATEEEAAELRRRFLALLPQATVVTLNGSSPGPRLDPLFASLAGECRASGRRVILDSYGAPALAAARVPPHWIRCNRDELASAYGLGGDDPWPALLRLAGPGLEGVLVSDGAEVVHCVTASAHRVAVPPRVHEVNPVGCGDALTGAFALGLEQHGDLDLALRWGVAAGTANAEQLSVCEITRERWLELVDQVRLDGP